MSTLFLIICSVAVVFYVVFLIECSRPRHAAKRVSVTGRQHGYPPGSVVPGFTPDLRGVI